MAGGDSGTRTTRTRRRAAVSCLPARKSSVRSEDGAAGLVRLVSRRRLAQCAGSIGTSNVACRGLTPDLTTAIQAVAKSGVEAGRTGAGTRITDVPFGESAPAGCRRPTPAPKSATDAALRACLSARCLLGRPAFHLGSQPELHAARSQIEHRLWHVGVPPLILGDGVAVSEPEDFRNALCVEEILGVDFRGHAD